MNTTEAIMSVQLQDENKQAYLMAGQNEAAKGTNSSDSSTTAPPNVNVTQLWQDLKAWDAVQSEIKLEEQKLKALAALKNIKSPMMYMQEVMLAIGNVQGAEVKGYAALMNVNSDIRNSSSSIQQIMSWMEATLPNNPNSGNTKVAMASLYTVVANLQLFVSYEQSLGSNATVSGSYLDNLQNSINSIKEQFGSAWGNSKKMSGDILNWVNAATGGKTSPQLAQITSACGQINQTSSSLGTATQTNLQFLTGNIQQMLASVANINKSITQMLQAVNSNVASSN